MLYTVETVAGALIGVAETREEAMKLVRTHEEHDKAEGTYRPGSYTIGHGDEVDVIQ
jgi:hypothetical protein